MVQLSQNKSESERSFGLPTGWQRGHRKCYGTLAFPIIWYVSSILIQVIDSRTCVQAPGEAEAELAQLNRQGYIDAVLTDDSDALVFGASFIINKYV
jgi:hypothetical protein